jgi:hypothetical protein
MGQIDEKIKKLEKNSKNGRVVPILVEKSAF